jgi:ribonucleoside-triphosphate reductase
MDKNKSEKLGKDVRFERIRRITGYLVGTMDKWNNAKKAEERDRVKHVANAEKWRGE